MKEQQIDWRLADPDIAKTNDPNTIIVMKKLKSSLEAQGES